MTAWQTTYTYANAQASSVNVAPAANSSSVLDHVRDQAARSVEVEERFQCGHQYQEICPRRDGADHGQHDDRQREENPKPREPRAAPYNPQCCAQYEKTEGAEERAAAG
jgi:hypothetical protein